MTPSPRHAAPSEALGHAVSDKRVEVLRRVGESGPISQAARDAGISYKAGWQVERTVDGWIGGGARITAQGEQLLKLADELACARDDMLARFAGGAQWVRVDALSLAGCAYVGWHTDSPVPERCNGSPKSADSDTGFGS
jgi:molybdate transport system regulatory protein